MIVVKTAGGHAPPAPWRGEDWAGGGREGERKSERARERGDQAHTVADGEGHKKALPGPPETPSRSHE